MMEASRSLPRQVFKFRSLPVRPSLSILVLYESYDSFQTKLCFLPQNVEFIFWLNDSIIVSSPARIHNCKLSQPQAGGSELC